MTTEQKNNLLEAIDAESKVLLIGLTDDMLMVGTELGFNVDDLQKFAIAAFESMMRGKVQSSVDRAIKAKYIADCKGKVAVSSELEAEIQKGIQLKKLISQRDIMTPKPERKLEETVLAYMLRLAEWDKIHLAECRAQARSIDSAFAKPKISQRRATTKQTELDRRSLHEHAENNPALRKVLREMQRKGIAI